MRSRLKLLELMRDKAESLLPDIEQRLGGASLPLAPALQQAVVDGNNLLKALSLGYAMVADAVCGKWSGLGFQKPLLLAVSQALRLNGRRLELAYAAYARGSRSAWTELHRLYRLARAAGAASMPAGERGGIAGTALRQGAAAGFCRADPLRAGRPGSGAVLPRTLRPSGAARTGVHAAGPGRARRLPRPRGGDGGRILAPPMARRCVAAQRPGAALRSAGEEAAGADRRPGTGHPAGQARAAANRGTARISPACCGNWPPVERAAVAPPPRTRFRPRVDVVLGCTALRAFISGPAFHRRTQDGPIAADAEGEMTEWSVTNESPDGFALRYVGGNTGEVKVGEILAIRPRGSSAMHIAIVRRATSTVASLEIGVQMLASRAAAATVNLPGEAGRNRSCNARCRSSSCRACRPSTTPRQSSRRRGRSATASSSTCRAREGTC
ncbi:MAG: hypothetical protein MZW92_05515 [Comamonadaceae bacterium]|nr:hypothetical protein [Comamonadaceae bacterium]